jgi:hypothetical protein
MTPETRTQLRAALLEVAPWLSATEVGPRAVSAGSCDRCGSAPRLLPTCGPTRYEALCRACADAEGDDAWCDGHLDDGRSARVWAGELPPRWADAVVLWWVATGELRDHTSLVADPSSLAAELGPEVRAALRA